MKILTKEQLDKLAGFRTGGESLQNGERGFCPETNTIVTCCANCGEFEKVKLDGINEQG